MSAAVDVLTHPAVTLIAAFAWVPWWLAHRANKRENR